MLKTFSTYYVGARRANSTAFTIVLQSTCECSAALFAKVLREGTEYFNRALLDKVFFRRGGP